MATFTGVSYHDVLDRAFTQFPRLGERRKQTAGTLSGGEQQMLAMARALATDPAVLLIDELSMGLAPIIVEELYDHVRRIAASGLSILIVEQFAHEILGIADRAGIMLHGRLVALGAARLHRRRACGRVPRRRPPRPAHGRARPHEEMTTDRRARRGGEPEPTMSSARLAQFQDEVAQAEGHRRRREPRAARRAVGDRAHDRRLRRRDRRVVERTRLGRRSRHPAASQIIAIDRRRRSRSSAS